MSIILPVCTDNVYTLAKGLYQEGYEPTLWILICLLSRKTPGGKATSLIWWENSREHSDTNYTVYALRFMSLTRQVFVVCAHRIWRALGKDLSLSCRHNSLLPCCKSSGGRGASATLRANLTAYGTLGCEGSDKEFCNPSFVFRTFCQ